MFFCPLCLLKLGMCSVMCVKDRALLQKNLSRLVTYDISFTKILYYASNLGMSGIARSQVESYLQIQIW